MKVLRFIGLGLAAVGVTGSAAFVARLLRNSRRCPHCGGTLEIESFVIVDDDDQDLTNRTTATCGMCDRSFVSLRGAPWTDSPGM
jgi:hypothetical protein